MQIYQKVYFISKKKLIFFTRASCATPHRAGTRPGKTELDD